MCKALLPAFALLLALLRPASAEPVELAVRTSVAQPAANLVVVEGALWALGDGKLLRIDLADGSVAEVALPQRENAAALGMLERYRGLAVGEGALWLPDVASSTILKVDPAARAVVAEVPTDIFGSRGSIGVGEGSLWVVTFDARDKRLTRYSAATGTIEAQIELPAPGFAVLAAYGAVWVTAANRAELYRIDPETNAIAATIALAAPSPLLLAAADSLWIAGDANGILQRIDPLSGQVSATVATGVLDMESDGDLIAGGGYLWTINRASVIARIDPASNAVEGVFRPPPGSSSTGRRLAFGAGSLWISGAGVFQLAPP